MGRRPPNSTDAKLKRFFGFHVQKQLGHARVRCKIRTTNNTMDIDHVTKVDSPAEDTKNEVHDEEGAEDDHGDEVDELPRVPHRVLDLLNVSRQFVFVSSQKFMPRFRFGWFSHARDRETREDIFGFQVVSHGSEVIAMMLIVMLMVMARFRQHKEVEDRKKERGERVREREISD